MSDVIVTLPLGFEFNGLKGIDAWIAEGDAAGLDASGKTYMYTIFGELPKIRPEERVYVCYNGHLIGYAPLVELRVNPYRPRQFAFIRGGGAVAVTIPECIPGFRGWRYRWWDTAAEIPFPDWITAAKTKKIPVSSSSPPSLWG